MRVLTSHRQRHFYLLLMVGVILLAAFFRLHQLDTLPPGLYHDEAYNGVDALHLLQSGRFPIFFPGNSGREPLHIYLQALSLALLGSSAWSLRFMSALMGILTVPLVYRLARSLFYGSGHHARLVGLLAATSLAFSFWHIAFSRIAFRAVYFLPLLVAAVWLFWRGRQRQSLRSFAGSGIALGLTLYTYLPARLLSIFFVLLVLLQFPQLWRQAGGRLLGVWRLPFVRGSVITAVLALLIFLPLGQHLRQSPDLFLARSGDISIFEENPDPPFDNWRRLGGNIVDVARMFIDRGDPKVRHNLPGRPVVNFLETAALLVGIGIAVKNFRRPRYYLLLLWFVVMLLPTILAKEAPHSLRAIGALPVTVILVALGLSAFLNRLQRWRAFPPAQAGVTSFVILSLISGVLTYRAYFLQWPNEPELPVKYDIQEFVLAQEALSALETSDVVVPFELHNHPTFYFLTAPLEAAYEPLTSRQGERPTILLMRLGQSLQRVTLLHKTADRYAFSSVPPLRGAQVSSLLNANAHSILFGDEPIGQKVEDVGDQLPQTAVPVDTIQADMDHLVTLLGYSINPPTVNPGRPVTLTLYWQSQAPLPVDYKSFAHLYTAAYDIVAKQNQMPFGIIYPTSLWLAGDTIVDSYQFTMPSDAAPGKYQFDVGMSSVFGSERLAVLNQNQEVVGDHILVGAVTVADPDEAAAPPQNITHVLYAGEDRIQLLGYDLENAQLSAGELLDFTLHWQAAERVAQDYTVFVHIINEAGEIVAQQDMMPGNGRYRTSLWFADEIIRDRYQIPLPADLPVGQYQVGVGLYFWPTGERLQIQEAHSHTFSDGRLILPTTLFFSD